MRNMRMMLRSSNVGRTTTGGDHSSDTIIQAANAIILLGTQIWLCLYVNDLPVLPLRTFHTFNKESFAADAIMHAVLTELTLPDLILLFITLLNPHHRSLQCVAHLQNSKSNGRMRQAGAVACCALCQVPCLLLLWQYPRHSPGTQ